MADFSNWMGEIDESLHNVPLNSIAIPGSHNSFAYALDKSGPLESKYRATIGAVAQLVPGMVNQIAYSWGLTQSMDITQQLNAGIRYIDLRLSTKPGHSETDLYLCHGLFGDKLQTFLEKIKSFMDSHPKEIVLVDFQKLYDFTEASHTRCMEIICNVFGEKMCMFLDTDSVTLSTLWESGLQVLVFYRDPVAEENFQFWPMNSIRSPFADSSSTQNVMNFLENRYACGREGNKFHITQGTMTPDQNAIMSTFMMGTLKEFVRNFNGTYCEWLKTKQASKTQVNICVMDFVEMANFIPIVVGLNKKR